MDLDGDFVTEDSSSCQICLILTMKLFWMIDRRQMNLCHAFDKSQNSEIFTCTFFAGQTVVQPIRTVEFENILTATIRMNCIDNETSSCQLVYVMRIKPPHEKHFRPKCS